MDYRNDLEIWVYHLKRGGGHAVMTWLARTAGRRVFHLNNNFTKPFKVKWRRQRIFRTISNPERRRGGAKNRTFGVDLEPGTNWREVAAMHKEVLLLNVENFRLDRVPAEPLHCGGAEPIIGRSRRRITVLVLRDAFNTFASVRAGKRRMKRRLKGFYQNHWKDYAKEFLGETSFLPADTIMVSFNRWFSDEVYRRNIADACGFEYSEAGLDEVSGDGGGSSFSGQDFDNRARVMNVLERWRNFEDDRMYRSAFDEETIELSNRIFGDPTNGRITAR